MSPPRYFTVEEANALLPKVEPLMAHLMERRAKVARLRQQMAPYMDERLGGVGGRIASEMAVDFIVIEQLIDKIQSYGCVVKSINAGLLDFLAKRDGRHVYLCWRYGEPKIEFYHELHTGFNGRRHV